MTTSDGRMSDERDDRPKRILAWAVEIFGPVADNRHERAMRFIEEGIELAQSCGLSRETIAAITERAYSRRTGTLDRELAQAGMTLEALAANIGFDLSGLIDDEFNRVREVPKDEWARRHAAKTAVGITADASQSLRAAAVRAVGDEEVAEVVAWLRAKASPIKPTIAELETILSQPSPEITMEPDGSISVGAKYELAANIIDALSASYSAACGERDARPTPDQFQRGVLVATTDEIASLKAQLSLALVERDRAREAGARELLESLKKAHLSAAPHVKAGYAAAIIAATAFVQLTPAPNAPRRAKPGKGTFCDDECTDEKCSAGHDRRETVWAIDND